MEKKSCWRRSCPFSWQRRWRSALWPPSRTSVSPCSQRKPSSPLSSRSPSPRSSASRLSGPTRATRPQRTTRAGAREAPDGPLPCPPADGRPVARAGMMFTGRTPPRTRLTPDIIIRVEFESVREQYEWLREIKVCRRSSSFADRSVGDR